MAIPTNDAIHVPPTHTHPRASMLMYRHVSRIALLYQAKAIQRTPRVLIASNPLLCQAKAIERKNWHILAQELARGSDAAAASAHQTGRLTMAVAEGQLRLGLAPDYLAQERQRDKERQADDCGDSGAADSDAKVRRLV